MTAPCPQPSGYVQQLCVNHTPFPSVHHLAQTGDNWGVFAPIGLAFAVCLVIVGIYFIVVGIRRLRNRVSS